MKTRLFNFNIPEELYDYLKEISEKNYSTMTKYLIDLIVKDKKLLNEIKI